MGRIGPLGSVLVAVLFMIQATPASGSLTEALASACGSPSEYPVRILWDDFGIPHIYSPNLLGAVRGYGYAQMEAHAELILRKVAEARGRSAEYFGAGPDDSSVTNDTQVATYGIADRAQQWFQEGGLPQQLLLESFVTGENQYANEHLDTIDPVFQKILPLKPSDPLAIFQFTIHFNFMPYQSNVPQLLADWRSGALTEVEVLHTKIRQASNGWALGPEKSASGNSILLGNPHLAWGINQPLPGLGVYQWFEAQLVVGDPAEPLVNASGVSFVGAPFIGIGFNDFLGWTHTNNPIKNVDLYQLQLARGGYLFDGTVRPFTQKQTSFKVRQPDGSFIEKSVTVRSSVHGPIVAERNDKALALRVAGLNTSSVVSQYWEMMLSRHLWEFILANSQLQMPFFNVIYADRDGQIMYLFGGRQPRRVGGTYKDYAGILDGTTSRALWTDTLDWFELPRTINPTGAFVQNSNDPPWFASFPQSISPDRYPRYIASEEMLFRPQQSAAFLLSRSKFSTDEILRGKESTHMTMADRVLPDLISAAKASADAHALAAANVLEQWDRQSDASSRGAVLFKKWYDLYSADSSTPKDPRWGHSYPEFRTEFSPGDPLTTPSGLSKASAAVPSLIAAAKAIKADYGRLDVSWGEINRVVLATPSPDLQKAVPLTDLPGSGSDEPFGSIRKVYYYPSPDKKQFFGYGGDTYVQLVEFTKEGPKAQALLTYGNWSRPGRTHITDQVSYFENKQLRPVYRTCEEVEAHAQRAETLRAARAAANGRCPMTDDR
jgi:acyl-homoserine-lactone acylase